MPYHYTLKQPTEHHAADTYRRATVVSAMPSYTLTIAAAASSKCFSRRLHDTTHRFLMLPRYNIISSGLFSRRPSRSKSRTRAQAHTMHHSPLFARRRPKCRSPACYASTQGTGWNRQCTQQQRNTSPRASAKWLLASRHVRTLF